MPTNRLIHESSPYLSQHGHNPVDWYPWCEEAFAKAKQENKPVLLSIGYSACHWCHVMESESFENEAIAALMNRHFVSIKVDREERPDLDEIYMNAVQMMTGHGGWPMTVFLTPDGKPFYGGTYFPPEDRHNMPGFPRVLEAVAQAYREKPQDVEKNVREVLAAMSRMNALKETRETLSLEVLEAGAQGLARSYDGSHGGFGRAPKFPNAGVYNLFLRCYKISKNQHYLEMVTETLTQMARGGIYDHLGGGFHRYSVDEKWLVPHFEKMLYDNAQLLQVYVDVFRITREDFFKQVVEQTMEYLLREMFDTNGGFYSTQDADSEGHEGKFFVWTPAEVRNLVGEEASEIFCRVYDVSDAGNFEGHNILHPILTTAQAARYFKKPESEIHAILADAKQRLFAEREKRVKPFRDEKILTSWNGLMLSGIAHAYGITHSGRYRDAALKTVEFIFSRMFKDGLLLHTYKDGRAKLLGYLDDYAFLVAGLLDVYEATFERAPLQRAEELCRKMIEEFWDDIDGGFYYTGRSHEKLISRTKPAFDSSIPSGNSVGAQVLMRLYHYTGDEDFQARGEKLLRLNYDGMVQQPFGLSTMLGVLDFYLSKPQEIVVVADRNEPGATELLHRIHLSYLPNKTLQVVPASESLEQASPLLAGKTQVDGKPTVYVCHNFTCSPPFTEWDDSR